MTNIKSFPLFNSGDNYTELVTITVKLYGSKFSDIKAGLISVNVAIDEDIFIDRPHSDYDCTGKHFTQSIDTLSRSIERNMDGNLFLVIVLKHWISIDV